MEQGLRVREYVPVGEMIPGMAYLVRRLLENTSNQSWLRAGFSADVPDEVLLAAPGPTEPAQARPPAAVGPHRSAIATVRRGDPASAFAGRRRAGRRSADVQRAVARFLPGRSAAAVCQSGGRGNVPQVAAVGAELPAGDRHGRRGLSRLARSPAVGALADPRCGPPPPCAAAATGWPP